LQNQTQRQSQASIDVFMLIAGAFLGLIVGVAFLLRMQAIETEGQLDTDDPAVQAEVDERLAPVGRVVLMGADELAAAAAVVEAPGRVDTVLSGPQVYNEACYLCHAAPGVGGAPVIGDAAAWAPRISKGMEILSDHVINGFQGDAGVMPPKGGRVDLSDEEVIAGIQYMLEQVEQ
jgi:cytochrome c5